MFWDILDFVALILKCSKHCNHRRFSHLPVESWSSNKDFEIENKQSKIVRRQAWQFEKPPKWSKTLFLCFFWNVSIRNVLPKIVISFPLKAPKKKYTWYTERLKHRVQRWVKFIWGWVGLHHMCIATIQTPKLKSQNPLFDRKMFGTPSICDPKSLFYCRQQTKSYYDNGGQTTPE